MTLELGWALGHLPYLNLSDVHFPMNLHSISNECNLNEIFCAPCEYWVSTYSQIPVSIFLFRMKRAYLHCEWPISHCAANIWIRFGKSSHISMICNCVTHLRSYTNSAITNVAGNSAPISAVTPRDRRAERRHLRIEPRYRRIEWPPRDRRRRCPKRRRLHIEHWYRRIEWRVFHDVSQCFKSVSWCFTSGLRCMTMFYMCFMMFYYV